MTREEPSDSPAKNKGGINPLIAAALISLAGVIIAPVVDGVFSLAKVSIEQSPESRNIEQKAKTEDCSELRDVILKQQETNPESIKISFPDDSPEQKECNINEFMKGISEQ